jgi:hypothetical protein
MSIHSIIMTNNMIKTIKTIIQKVKQFFIRRKIKKMYNKKIEELRKRDPFIYKH